MLPFPRFRSRLAAGVSVLVLAASWLSAQAPAQPTFTNVTVHDPALVRVGNTYYVFGSHLAAAKSDDLMRWTQISTDYTNVSWVPNPATVFQEGLAWANKTLSGGPMWAPDMFQLPDGRFAFYYCVAEGTTSRSALGLATSNSIEGPFTNVQVFLRSGMWNQTSPDGTVYNNTVHPNAIDPSIFWDADGKLWMVYGSFSGGLFVMEMDPATGLPKPNQGYGKKLTGGNHVQIEGPNIVYSPETGYYYLFMTYGGLGANDGYNIRMGRSLQPDGPYLDAAGNDLINAKAPAGAPIFHNPSIEPYGVKLMGNWRFNIVSGEPGTAATGYRSPGGMQMYRNPENGKYVFAFHTRFEGRGELHEVRVHQMYLNEDGWFVAAPHRFAHETIGWTDPNVVPGDYKLVNHGKDITGTVKTSTLVTLGADGTVSGSATGTWNVTGEHYASLTLGGVTYKGVFSPQWDDDNKAWVLTFSAISNEGVSVWGSKVAISRPVAAPTITRAPVGATPTLGQPLTLSIGVTASPAPTYQWRKDGVDIAGATRSSYTIPAVGPTHGGTYTVVVANSAGSVTSAAAVVNVPSKPAQVVVPAGDVTTQVINLSTRGIVSSGDNVLVAGFVISGPAKKQVLIRAIGANLRRFGLTDVIGRPVLKLYRQGSDIPIFENSDWQTAGAGYAAAEAKTGAFGLVAATDTGYGDAALLVELDAGLYTATAGPGSGSATQEGIGLVEIYDVTPNDGSRLINLSSRGRVETGPRAMTVGVSVTGSGHARLLVRGIGPTLRAFGLPTALGNPSIEFVTQGTGVLIGSNDDWWLSAQTDQIGVLGNQLQAFELGATAADAAVLVRVAPGGYTAIITPAPGETGVALAELYEAN